MPEVTSVVAVLQVEEPAVATTPGVISSTTTEQCVGLEATTIVIESQRMD